ncbi:MAG TPA: ABC transporter permease [Puia sp.]|nr:ABC transporter permease [Puia sp.]
MDKTFFKTSIRSFGRNKVYSLLNVSGLAIGIACAALIFLWVEDELSFNHNFSKRDRLYRVMENQSYEGKISTFVATPGRMASAIRTEIPGIRNSTKVMNSKELFSSGEKNIYVEGAYADSSIFSMLLLPFTEGSMTGAFDQLHSIVISRSMAETFFGDGSAVGKVLRMGHDQDYRVSGVFADLPMNSTLKFKWLIPFEVVRMKYGWLDRWDANGVATFVELEPAASLPAINDRLRNFLGSKMQGVKTQCFLFSMNDWNLYNHFTNGKQDDGGGIQYVRLFSRVAWIILLIACVNFMNLATARSERRAKEVGVRKVMGAERGRLIGQFIGESTMVSFTALLLGVGITWLALPSFNTLVEKQLSLNILAPLHLGWLLSVGLITGLLAGIYPAFYLSSFNPINVLKALKIRTSGGAVFLRKGLVTGQFAASLILLISTIIIYQQIQYVKSRDMGYSKDHLLYLELQGDLGKKFHAVRDELIASGVVRNAALSASVPLAIGNNTDNFKWPGSNAAQNISITEEWVSPEYIATMDMKILQGRDFYATPKVDSSNVVINESMAKVMGKAGHPGGIISDGGTGRFQIVGIIRDFLYNDMYASPAPLILFCNPDNAGYLNIRFRAGEDIRQTTEKITGIIRALNPGYPADYRFLDEDFAQMFKLESMLGRLAGLFATLAIILSGLGLLGLTAYTVEKRTREVAIRKVLGASAFSITEMLSRQFLRPVLISFFIAFPLTWWIMSNWLSEYQYHIRIDWLVFAAAGLLMLVITLASVVVQTIKAAVASPVSKLRSE